MVRQVINKAVKGRWAGRGVWVAMGGLYALMTLLAGCGPAPSEVERPPVHTDLHQHSAEFEQQVVQVGDNIHVAVGYGLANSIMIEGDDGLIIVDTLESKDVAKRVLAEFRKISDKPIKAIVLTHNHSDHIFGASVFAEGNSDIPVYAHDTTNDHIDNILSVIRPVIYTRSMRMFGNFLSTEQRPNDGIGPFLDMQGMAKVGLLRPTHTFAERLAIEVAGIELELIHAPGETDDQLVVWLPQQQTLLPADNIYKAFPNLYTIRGTAYRDVMAWVGSLDMMRGLKPQHLVPSHGRPLSGAKLIASRLTNYRDAIQYVHDQTIRGINRGASADELAREIKLPPHLASDPYLQPYYGNVAFSVRSIFTGYLGWFSGNAEDLLPLSQAQRASRWRDALLQANSLGGNALETNALETIAQQALAAEDYSWALEVAALLLAETPNNAQALDIKARALRAMGEVSSNAPARNYLLTQALEADGALTITQPLASEIPPEVVQGFPIDSIMHSMPAKLKAEDCLDLQLRVGFEFTDINQHYTVTVRRGVAEVVAQALDNTQARISVSSELWKRIVTQQSSPVASVASGALSIDGSISDLLSFLSLFEQD